MGLKGFKGSKGLMCKFFLLLIFSGLWWFCYVLAKIILPVLEIVVYLQRERVRMRA